MNLEDAISNKRNTLKTDRLDMSFGELLNIFEDEQLIISPEYQRAFRWTVYQQTRFIESILLGIPIPPIFVAEDKDGKWELVDGLQRVSTVFSFFGVLEHLPDKNNLKLVGGDIIDQLNGITVDELPLKLKISIKRSVCRVEIVRWDSNEDYRYELFNRLNTGSVPLSSQEIRNCIFRSYPIDLNSYLVNNAKNQTFIDIVGASERKKDEMYLEELVLRYFAFRNLQQPLTVPVKVYLDEFMLNVSKGREVIDLKKYESDFIEMIKFLNDRFGKKIFRPNSTFALNIYDSICFSFYKVFDKIQGNEERIESAIKRLLIDDQYTEISTSTFSNSRMFQRMQRAEEVLKDVSSS